MANMTKHQKELEAKLFGQLNTSKEDLVRWENDPYLMDSATVIKFWQYIEKAPAVIIVGDYDCDGICASYILGKSIKNVHPKKTLSIRIPKRQAEGYGINAAILDEIKSKLPKDSLVVTVDNGIAAPGVLEDLKQSGYKVIITDHHALKEDGHIPEVDMVLDPAVEGVDDAFIGDYWCGAAVAFKLAEQVVSKSIVKELEIYAGIATVADCMKLKEGNWGLVRKSIKSFRRGMAPMSLNELLIAMKQQPEYVNADTYGFYLGPAFNAAGRLFDDGPNTVLQYLFKPTDEGKKKIIEYNDKRKQLRDDEYELVKKAIEESNQINSCPIWVYVPHLHEGIVGILAGKVTEDYHVPAIVLTDSKEAGFLKGSARSVDEVHIFNYLCENDDLLFKFGGHAGAAGLTIEAKNLKELQKRQIKLNIDQTKTVERIFIDKEEIPDMLPIVEECMPFGEGNPNPYFAINIDKNSDNVKMVGEELNHLIIDKSRPSDGNYKITHFFHDPNDLHDKNNFLATGHISQSGFRGASYASFNTEFIEDIHTLDPELAK